MKIKMKKIPFLVCLLFIVIGYGVTGFYIQTNHDNYGNMSVVPVKDERVPLYEGLKPSENEFYIKGFASKEIQSFYETELKQKGWKMEYSQYRDDWNGFQMMVKTGKEALIISGIYDVSKNQTKVTFKLH